MKKVPGRNGHGTINRLEKGETANPNGRPRKFVKSIIGELQKNGCEPATAEQIKHVFEYLFNLTAADLKKITSDPATPIVIKICATGLRSKQAFHYLETMADRAHGKAKQAVDIAHTGEITTQMSDEEFAKKLKKANEILNG